MNWKHAFRLWRLVVEPNHAHQTLQLQNQNLANNIRFRNEMQCANSKDNGGHSPLWMIFTYFATWTWFRIARSALRQCRSGALAGHWRRPREATPRSVMTTRRWRIYTQMTVYSHLRYTAKYSNTEFHITHNIWRQILSLSPTCSPPHLCCRSECVNWKSKVYLIARRVVSSWSKRVWKGLNGSSGTLHNIAVIMNLWVKFWNRSRNILWFPLQ